MKSKQDNSLSRRNFVKRSTLATTGILSAGLPVGAMANVYGNKKLKLALVGCGGRGRSAVVQALQADENVELVAPSLKLQRLAFHPFVGIDPFLGIAVKDFFTVEEDRTTTARVDVEVVGARCVDV